MAGFRFAPRLAVSWYFEQRRKTRVQTIIVGAGNAGDLLARDIVRSQDSKHWVVGFVDDDPAKLHTSLSGKPVLGKVRDLPRFIQEHEIEMVLLAIPRLPAERI
jgi:FlaA1/EpsC-like NDP-sugar epimerase